MIKRILRSIFRRFIEPTSAQPASEQPAAELQPAKRRRRPRHRRKHSDSQDNAQAPASAPDAAGREASSPDAQNRSDAPRRPRPPRDQQRPQRSIPEADSQAPAVPTAPAAPRQLPADNDFAPLGLDERILQAVADLGFCRCTPIQAGVLPHSLAGRDITGRAQTGTGKTAAFLITIAQRFLKKHNNRRESGRPFALVLAPTRELALQIGKDAENICKHTAMRNLVVYGGMDHAKQRELLGRGVDLVIATPGRLIDYIQSRSVDLVDVELLVIDEADRMLDMGFIPDVRRIVSRIPHHDDGQTLFFSATLTPEILRLAGSWLHDPHQVEITPQQVVPVEIEQTVYSVTDDDKLALLLWILQNQAGSRVLVFRNRRNTSEWLYHQLQRYGIKCALLSGDVEQKKRLHVLEAFRAGSLQVIVATDVAGRGIHVDDISHVINYDLPYEADDYVHRIGRTGRAGVKGKAVSFACERESFVLPEIEEYIKQPIHGLQPEPEMLKLPHPLHPGAVPPLPPRDRPPAGGRGGGRGRGGSRSGPPRGGRRPPPRRP